MVSFLQGLFNARAWSLLIYFRPAFQFKIMLEVLEVVPIRYGKSLNLLNTDLKTGSPNFISIFLEKCQFVVSSISMYSRTIAILMFKVS
ncbi:hypothetical protein MTR_4g023450 [Medicago truncatula]|uniref:Uncharacterized protein n=1 Tax=Medicago truncatula TaxID=3880 RepID=G7JDD0_MEDTR|nr:hypothetical protein MTR_4g023450 [Medicago truncatula]